MKLLRPCGSSQIDPSSDALNWSNNIKVADVSYISRLSDDILRIIVSKLSIGDAVRTSVLSRQWKHIWPTCSWPVLSFSPLELFGNRECWDAYENPCAVFTKKFIEAVFKFMWAYQWVKVDTFKVMFCLRSDSEIYVNLWVFFAHKRGAKKLVLDFCCPKSCTLVNDDERYVLYVDHFEGREINVKELSLVSCSIATTSFSRLCSLKALNLSYMSFALDDLQSILPSLMNLEELNLIDCNITTYRSYRTKRLCLGALVLLKSFLLRTCNGIEVIELSNPNMTSLFCVPVEPIRLNLDGTPKLLQLCLYVQISELSLLFSRLHQCLPLLTTLRVFSKNYWLSRINGTTTHASSSVTNLNLVFNRLSEFDILSMISILQSLPCLEKLVIQMGCWEDVQSDPTGELGDFLHICLRHVEIHGFYGTRDQIEFVIYLLNHAPSLQRLCIFRTMQSYSDDGWLDVHSGRASWNHLERESICDKLAPHMREKGSRSGLQVEIQMHGPGYQLRIPLP